MSTFFSLPSEKNATKVLSGDQNTCVAPSVPTSSLAVGDVIGRIHIRSGDSGRDARNATCVPSGGAAMNAPDVLNRVPSGGAIVKTTGATVGRRSRLDSTPIATSTTNRTPAAAHTLTL